ncbi:MAG: hypothetical protein K8S21_08520 [Gemmatimonadetes bacterium]|nr:hypothetical protein [Gemmatimonadota bacterium]
MLAYLDALIDALSLRDRAEVTRLLAHPLSRILPAPVREEANTLAEGRCDALAAPMRLMQLRHQTAELLRESPPVAELADVATDARSEVADAPRIRRAPAPARAHRPARLVQMELPLSA